MEKPKPTKSENLAKELGPRNEYDQTAGQAIILGMSRQDQKLVDMGTELADLIQKVPYHHDQFYKVIAKNNELKKHLEKIKKQEEHHKIDELITEADFNNRWVYIFEKKENQYIITIQNYRFVGHIGLNNEKYEQISKYMDREMNIEKRKTSEEIFDFHSTYQTQYTYYYDDNDNIIVEKQLHDHEDEVNMGVTDKYFFSNREDAQKKWDELKNIFQQDSAEK